MYSFATQRARYDLNCVESAVKLQTNQPCRRMHYIFGLSICRVNLFIYLFVYLDRPCYHDIL